MFEIRNPEMLFEASIWPGLVILGIILAIQLIRSL